jgi:cell division septation protein DedD
MQDDAFHEIQLNGKQLVFLFMAATVVAVVIFLCGVMVGRGVPQQLASGATGVPLEASVDPTALSGDREAPPATSSSSSGSSGAAPLTAGETLTYPGRLEEPTPPVETLRPPGLSRAEGSETAATSSVPAPTPPAAPARDPVVEAPVPSRVEGPRPVAAAPAASEPAGNPSTALRAGGFVVQVAAVKERSEADTMARRLSGKGYPAFVTTTTGGVQMFRVRVGTFPDRREAESVAGRLQKEEQFKPWITR